MKDVIGSLSFRSLILDHMMNTGYPLIDFAVE